MNMWVLTRCNYWKHKLKFCACVTLLMLYYLCDLSNFPRNIKVHLKSNISIDVHDSPSTSDVSRANTKYILYWIPFWKMPDNGMGIGYDPFKTCEYKNCYATSDPKFMPLEKFHLLSFHAIYNKNKMKQPRVRKPDQIYVYMNMESPFNTRVNLKPFASYFNWTMSYRFDSDIVRRHGSIIPRETYVDRSKELFHKTKLAAWFVSHCKTASRREILVKEIQKYMSVDIYGACGKLKCPRRRKSMLSPETCYDNVEKNYKFYFSFENSYCKDYSTEKLYDILKRNIVPVVYGAGDYNLSAPPYSVINVANYHNVSHLVNYLKYLDKNDDKYLEYFEWKKHYFIGDPKILALCQICKKLNEPPEKKVYHDLFRWWWGKHGSMCKKDKLLPKIVSQLL